MKTESTHRWSLTFAAVCTTIVILLALRQCFRPEEMSTIVGEQRLRVLEDGTRVTLNTASHLVLRYSKRERRVVLKKGEASFIIVQQPEQPFRVAFANREVTALGTKLVVRTEDTFSSVLVVEGKASIRDVQDVDAPTTPREPSEIILNAGERETFDAHGGNPRRDYPDIASETAWLQGWIDLRCVRLADAIEMLNRYNQRKLRLDTDGALASVIVGGGTSIHGTESFAQALVDRFGVFVDKSDKNIWRLKGVPKINPESASGAKCESRSETGPP